MEHNTATEGNVGLSGAVNHTAGPSDAREHNVEPDAAGGVKGCQVGQSNTQRKCCSKTTMQGHVLQGDTQRKPNRMAYS